MIDVVRRLIQLKYDVEEIGEEGPWWRTTDNTLFQDFEEALRWQQMLLDKEGVKIIYAEQE